MQDRTFGKCCWSPPSGSSAMKRVFRYLSLLDEVVVNLNHSVSMAIHDQEQHG